MPIDELGGNKRLDPVRSNALSQGEGSSNPVLQDLSTKRQGMNFEILFQTSRPWQGSAWPVQKSQLTIINVCLTVKKILHITRLSFISIHLLFTEVLLLLSCSCFKNAVEIQIL